MICFPAGQSDDCSVLGARRAQAAVPPNRRRRRLSGHSSRRVDSIDTIRPPPYRRAALVAQFVTKQRKNSLFRRRDQRPFATVDRPARPDSQPNVAVAKCLVM